MRRARAAALVAALLLPVVACGGDGDSAGGSTGGGGGEGSDRLIVGLSADPTSLDFHAVSDASTELATWSINEGLVEFDAEGNVVPLLATEVPEVDPDDPLRWNVKLRDGVTFTNGVAFDAEAVKANVERVISTESPLLASLGSIDRAEVVDDLDVAIYTTEPDPVLDFRLTNLRLVEPGAAEEEGYSAAPVGTGPYKLAEWTRGDHLTLERNADYWGDEPTIGEVEMRIIPDDATRLSALEAGEIQLAQNITADQAANLPNVLTSSEPVEADATRIALFNPPYDDVRFRQALNYALDKETMAEELFGEFADVGECQIVPPAAAGYAEGLEPYPYDPDKARELLEEVDLPDDFVLEFDGSSGIWPGTRPLNEAMASYWEDIGLTVDLRINEASRQLDLLNAGGMGSEGGNPDAPDVAYTSSAASTMHASRQVGLYLDRDGFASTVGLEYPELDEMIDRAFSTFDDDERQAAYDDLANLACDEAMFVFGLARYDIFGAAENLEYEPTAGPLRRINFARVTLT